MRCTQLALGAALVLALAACRGDSPTAPAAVAAAPSLDLVLEDELDVEESELDAEARKKTPRKKITGPPCDDLLLLVKEGKMPLFAYEEACGLTGK